MPIYRYRCSKCANQVEMIQRMSEKAPPERCEACGCESFEQVIGSPMFVLKGRGWANDGYHYAKTPADTLPGYSDQDRQTILPNKKPQEPVNVTTMPKTEEVKPLEGAKA